MSTIDAVAPRLRRADAEPRCESNRSNRTTATTLFDHLRVFRRIDGVRILSEHGGLVFARSMRDTCAPLAPGRRNDRGSQPARDRLRALLRFSPASADALEF